MPNEWVKVTGDRRLGQHAEQQRRDRDAELGTRQVVREARQQTLHRRSARVALPRALVDASSVDGDQGEFRRNEAGVGDDQRQGGEEP